MQLRHYLLLVRRRWVAVVVGAVIAVLLAILVTPRTPLYEGRSTIYVGTGSFDLGTSSNDLSYQRTLGLDRLIETFRAMIDSETMAHRASALVESDLTAAELIDQTTVSRVKDTQLLYISVLDEDPVQAQALSDAMAEAFVNEVQRLETSSTGAAAEGSVPTLPASIFERAPLPTEPLPTGLFFNIVLAAMLGAAIAVAVIVVLDYLDVTIRSTEDAEARLGLPVLAGVPDFGSSMPRLPFTRAEPPGSAT